MSSGLKNLLTTFHTSTGPPCCAANLPAPTRTVGSDRLDAPLHHLYITAGRNTVNAGERELQVNAVSTRCLQPVRTSINVPQRIVAPKVAGSSPVGHPLGFRIGKPKTRIRSRLVRWGRCSVHHAVHHRRLGGLYGELGRRGENGGGSSVAP